MIKWFAAISFFIAFLNLSSADSFITLEQLDQIAAELNLEEENANREKLKNMVQPKGLINKTKAKLMGIDYWRDELKQINQKISECEAFQEEINQMWKEDRKLSRDLDLEMAKAYREYPDIAPTRAGRKAEKLREQADLIETAEMYRDLLKDNKKELEYLNKYKSGIEIMIEEIEGKTNDR